MNTIEAIILGILEGITEFLPISSTGHMILASSIMNIGDVEFTKTFQISIQIGAILSIVIIYAKQFLRSFSIYLKLGIAFIPSAIVGFLAYDIIKTYLFSPLVVAISLVIGGVILILINKKVHGQESAHDELEDISYKNAFYIGLFQCFSIIPGVSRAAATIIGGVCNGLNKKMAMEFSFLLAVPTMIAATGYDLLKSPVIFSESQMILLCIGLLTAFITAWITVKLSMRYINRLGFNHFGYYRIIIGIIFLIIIY